MDPERLPPGPAPSVRAGLRLLRAAVVFVVAFAGVTLGWALRQAAHNPDVRARRPRWLDAEAPFDWAFWTPLVLTIGVGLAYVLAIYVRAARRLAAGEDPFERRHGRGLRRRPWRALPRRGR